MYDCHFKIKEMIRMKIIKNINKGILIFVLFIIILFSLIIRISLNSEIEKNILNNYSHETTDIEFLMDEAIEYFKNLDVHIYEVRYDENKELEKGWADKTGGETIILTIDFKTSFFREYDGFSPNQKYLDYSVIYSKNIEGEWHLYDCGY